MSGKYQAQLLRRAMKNNLARKGKKERRKNIQAAAIAESWKAKNIMKRSVKKALRRRPACGCLQSDYRSYNINEEREMPVWRSEEEVYTEGWRAEMWKSLREKWLFSIL